MRLLPLCKQQDPLLKIVKEQYNAQPVALSQRDLDLLDVLVKRENGSYQRWGALSDLITDRDEVLDLRDGCPRVPVGDLSGMRSRGVEFHIGLELLGAILNAFGLPVPGICGAIRHSRHLSFKFSGVTKRSFMAAAIGDVLYGRSLRRTNLATSLLAEAGSMLIVDMVLESPSFSVNAEGRTGAGTKVDGPEIVKLVLDAAVGMKAEKTARYEMTFQGTADKPAVFGFSALRLEAAASGRLTKVVIGPPEVVLRSIVSGRPLRYASEPDGLEPLDIFPLGSDEIHLDLGIVDAVGIPDGPVVVNAAPAEIGEPFGLLVPDGYPGVPRLPENDESG
jgi:hypothetical protein